MALIKTRVNDFWRVNSYGYPSPFSGGEKALEAWETLLSFHAYPRYDALKSYWASTKAPRRLDHAAVESWKAAFEEFGLLFVSSGSNQINITPAGEQLAKAAEAEDKDAFAWIGLNLLLRYPLRGARRPKSPAHANSDLLLYRFLYSALLDLDGYVWWSELERVLCRVFHTNEAQEAISDVRTLRADPKLIDSVALPAPRRGAFYNSLNQVAVHAGMNHLLLGTSSEVESIYGVSEPKRRTYVREEWRNVIRRALNAEIGGECSVTSLIADRLPKSPEFQTEVEYFNYLGARVEPASAAPQARQISYEGEMVFVLEQGQHYVKRDSTSVWGPSSALCVLGRGQRLIFTNDDRWSYLVEDKAITEGSTIRVRVRRARPITNPAALKGIIGSASG